ncbi:helix-turn-helix domain-containing protein [Desulfitobacterium sp.]|uniref:helix-turn-helix domain-containing protein n=1 Tax=Desulfitobacterium sp. TaxID=49981 RepID=UPI002B21FA9D|nr:helix-turn-helix domain-containing protein [Desulfitobacterium sp.]MEA4900736.1 helix-turn-helix domain-containing protein [Desulfitobacterium sp.]
MEIKEKLFREDNLFTREDVLKSLELFIERKKLNKKSGYSNELVKNRVKLCEKFILAVEKCKLPALTELWWFYEYQFLGNSMELNLCQADEIEVENGVISGMTSTVEHTLITVECDYLTVEQYAAMHNVKPVTIRQWIRRGKLRHAKKNGRDWLIPDIEDKPRRGFTSVQYIVENNVHIESDEFPLLAICESISIFQDEDNKNKFICYLNNYKTKFDNKLELTRSEVERLEHTIIESGKARVVENIQYVPHILRDMED